MNSYFLGISGSWIVLVILVLAAIGLSIYTYRSTIPPVPRSRRILLTALRSTALILLIFSVFEPIMTMVRGLSESPKLAVLLDDSKSMSASDAGGSRLEKYQKALKDAGFTDLKPEDLRLHTFSEGVKSLSSYSFDSLKLNGASSDISRAVRYLSNYTDDENIRAALLVSDGAFNAGNNPLYDAENFGRPIYVIGIGDTSEPKDIAVLSVITNEVAYIDNPVPINVNVKSTGFPQGELKVVLSDNGQKIAEQTIQINPDNDKYSLLFEYMPKQEGIRKITANISPVVGEITTKNNTVSEFIKVLKNKRTIAFFAGAPSADVSFIKQNLLREKGVEIQEYLQKQGAEFYRAPNQTELSKAEIIILCGFPIVSTPKSVIDMIAREAESGKPILFAASQQTDYNKLKLLQNYLPFVVVSSRSQEFLAEPEISKQALSNPLLRVTGSDEDAKLWNSLPPLFRTETFVRPKPESEIVSTMKVNNVQLNDPLIMTRNLQNKKSAAILGYGLYRWKLLGYAAEISKGRTEVPDLFDILLTNSIRWLGVKEANKFVNVKTSKKAYNQNEKIEFSGEVYDASYTPIDKAVLKVKITGAKELREITMNSLGNGRYYGSIEGLAEADYAFQAEAYESSRSLGSDNGRFSVGELALEYQNLKMNIRLLKNIAERTGGKYYYYDQAADFINDLKNNRNFKDRAVSQKIEFALWNAPYLLGLAIILFGIEWFLRKKAGML